MRTSCARALLLWIRCQRSSNQHIALRDIIYRIPVSACIQDVRGPGASLGSEPGRRRFRRREARGRDGRRGGVAAAAPAQRPRGGAQHGGAPECERGATPTRATRRDALRRRVARHRVPCTTNTQLLRQHDHMARRDARNRRHRYRRKRRLPHWPVWSATSWRPRGREPSASRSGLRRGSTASRSWARASCRPSNPSNQGNVQAAKASQTAFDRPADRPTNRPTDRPRKEGRKAGREEGRKGGRQQCRKAGR